MAMGTQREIEQEFLTKPWKAIQDDLIGGICIVLEEETKTPATGAYVVVNFVYPPVAVHICEIHNESLKHGPE
jgi:hypothetical protein